MPQHELSLRLAIGQVGAIKKLTLTDDDFEYIASVFSTHSDEKISLQVDSSERDAAYRGELKSVHALHLHRRARDLNRNSSGDGPVKAVSILLAPSYTPRANALGVMFDRGYATVDDPNKAPFIDRPREGCAVFLNAIKSARKKKDRHLQTLYTAIHEIGHLFNLTHNLRRKSYMNTSPARSLPDSTAFTFTSSEEDWLEDAPESKRVWPGGDKYRGGSQSTDASEGKIELSDFRLKIAMAQRAFAASEPVELDIIVVPRDGIEGDLYFPDIVDPGYDGFDIWIETPEGERSKYRPINHYCSSGNLRTISRSDPLIRDISIFGQSGGATFSSPGIYKLWAQIRATNQPPLRSNKMEIEVKRSKDLSELSRLALKDNWVQQTLFYRNAPNTYRLRKFSRFLIEDCAIDQEFCGVHYAMARAIARQFEHKESVGASARERIERHIEAAARFDSKLGLRQMHHLAALYSDIQM